MNAASTAQSLGRRASAHAGRAGDSKWVEVLARLGLLARGLVYVLIGLLALQIALGHHPSQQANQQGALSEIAGKSFGQALLWIIAIGFLGYAVWQAGDAIGGFHSMQRGRNGKRFEAAVKAVIYLGFALMAAKTAMGSSSDQGGSGLTAKMLGWPGGQLLVGAAGVVLVIVGLVQAWQGFQKKFLERMSLGRLHHSARRAVEKVGQVGYTARGAVFAVFGALVITAAVQFDPKKAHGLDVALMELAKKPFGSFLLVLAALGLICFGAFSFVESRYRHDPS